MKKIAFFIAFSVAVIHFNSLAENIENTDKIEIDTIQNKLSELTNLNAQEKKIVKTLTEIVVISSSKETNPFKKLPGSASVISPLQIKEMQINDISDISSLVPNFFIADYGSKMTAPIYVRGIGNRITGQASGMYVDNIPYLNKTTFDFNFVDIQRIEILRGPQGTLYGRNAMGGIVNVFTPSSLDYQQTKISLTGGNHGTLRLKASEYSKINEDLGVSLAAYYDKNDGFFTNEYTGKNADASTSIGGRLRFDFKVNESLTGSVAFNYDYTDQGAFPYGKYDKATGIVQPVNYNDEGQYVREMFGNTLNLAYTAGQVLISSSTSLQTLKDDMDMDQDFTPLSLFTITQQQKQLSLTEEITVKSNNKNNYQWSLGLFGFSNKLKTHADVNFKEDGIKMILQPVFNNLSVNNPGMPLMTIDDNSIPIPGEFDTPTMGAAVFHQSTYNNFLIDGLSLTAGIRLDYEKTDIDYETSMAMKLKMMMGNRPMVIPMDTTIAGSESLDFTQLLPKVSLKYELDNNKYLYMSVSKGYNPGGFNIQMFSDIVRQALSGTRPGNNTAPPVSVKDMTSYKPEFSWNYEAGFKGGLFNDILLAELALFYIDVKDMQLTKFVESGAGRMLTNAGDAVSKGVDVSLSLHILPGLRAGINYGYSHATFSNYNDGKTDYSGKFLPFAPQQTFSFFGSFIKPFHEKWIDHISIQAQYNGAGKIYWTPANDVVQGIYGLLNFQVGVSKNIFALDFWMKNTLNTDYQAFYFESMGNSYVQKGKPVSFGADLILSF